MRAIILISRTLTLIILTLLVLILPSRPSILLPPGVGCLGEGTEALPSREAEEGHDLLAFTNFLSLGISVRVSGLRIPRGFRV